MTTDPEVLAAFIAGVLAGAAPLDSDTAALLAPLLPVGQMPVDEDECGSAA